MRSTGGNLNQIVSKKVSGRQNSVADFGESVEGVTRVVSTTLNVSRDAMASIQN